jgi:hypothetical protein
MRYSIIPFNLTKWIWEEKNPKCAAPLPKPDELNVGVERGLEEK